MGRLKAKSTKRGGGCGSFLFGLVFVVVGAGLMFVMGARPMIQVVRAHSWIETPCHITSSTLEVNSSSDGTTYRVAITYEYEFAGHNYRGDRYDFSFGSSSGRDGKQEAVRSYPAGSDRMCFVNPGEPTESVLNRNLDWYMLWGLFGLPFFAAGLFVIIASRRAGRRRARSAAADLEESDVPIRIRERIELKPRQSPMAKLIGTTIMALIWNGIVGGIAYAVLNDGFDDGFDIFPLIFLSIFGLIGLALLFAIPYQLLALGNPRPLLVLEQGMPWVGGDSQLSWNMTGRTDRLQNLVMTLRGREEATYRRGTNSYTAKEVFHDSVLYESSEPQECRGGTLTLAIPAGTMPTWDGGNNEIVWELEVHGDIPRWPDVKEVFVITVFPVEKG